MNIRCPLGHVLELDDADAEAQVACPVCDAVFEAPPLPMAMPVALPVGELVDPRQGMMSLREVDTAAIVSRLQPHFSALGRVRLGIGFHLAKIYATLIGITVLTISMVVVVGTMIQAQGQGPPRRGQMARVDIERVVSESPTLVVMFLAVAVVPPILGIIGSWLCTGVPRESGASGPIATALIADKLHIALALVAPLLAPPVRSLEPMLGVLLHLVAFVAFMNFLRNLAGFCGRGDLAERARLLLHWPYLLACGGVILFVLTLVIAAINPIGIALLAAVVLGVGFGFFMWLVRYILLLHELRAVLLPASEYLP